MIVDIIYRMWCCFDFAHTLILIERATWSSFAGHLPYHAVKRRGKGDIWGVNLCTNTYLLIILPVRIGRITKTVAQKIEGQDNNNYEKTGN